MKKIVSLLIFGIIVIMLSFDGYAQQPTWIKYAQTKSISFPGGKETDTMKTVEFYFSGNTLRVRGLLIWSDNNYGKYKGTSSTGDKVYEVRTAGVNIFGTRYDELLDHQYFLVSPDNSVINLVTNNAMGDPVYIYVFRKANTQTIEKIYR